MGGMETTHTTQFTARCCECNRVFDLRGEEAAAEWLYGHDCEVSA